MGVTRLKRKARRNKQTAAKRQNSMKQLSYQPVIKNVDKEALKESFDQQTETVVENKVVEAQVESVEAEVAEAEVTETEAAHEIDTAQEDKEA